MIRFKSRLLSGALFAATLCVGIVAPPAAPPASAEIVYDPTNHVENVLQAARALEQINNQLSSLANEARMLSQLNLQLSPELSQSIGAARQLLEQAQGIRQNLTTITSDMRALYPNDMHGLDHGNGSVALLTGPVKEGLYGELPSLTKIDDDGNLIATVGLDRYYATIAEQWFGVPASEVLPGSPKPLDGLL